MKRIISILTALVILAALFAIPASAATSAKEWDRMTGAGKLDVDSKGVSIQLDEGLTFYKYTKATFDIKNFSMKYNMKMNTDYLGGYFSVTMSDKKAFSGSTGLFLLFHMDGKYEFRLEGQILNRGYYLTPRSRVIDVEFGTDTTMYGKDNGNGTYSITFEGNERDYTFEIPETYQFTEDLNGQGYISFGGSLGPTQIEYEGYTPADYTFTVYEINGVTMELDPASVTSSSNTSNSSGNNSNITDSSSDPEGTIVIGGDPDTSDEQEATNDTDTDTDADTDTVVEEEGNNLLLIVIIICAVVIVLAAAAVVAIILIKKKKANAAADVEETEAEAEAEETTEE